VQPLFHRVLVTGANGLVGQAVVRRLQEMPEVDLLATSREAMPRYAGGSGGYAPLDVTDADAVRRHFLDFAPATVVHCAAMSKVGACMENREACWEANVDATALLARVCRAHGARLLLVSTDFIFDGGDGPYDERARPNPINFYGRSKLAAENAVRMAGLRRWTIIRTTLGFGVGDNLRRGNFGLWLVNQLLAGRQTPVTTDQIRTPIYVPDLADGIARAVMLGKNGIYHVAGRELISVWDLARKMADQLDLDRDLLVPVTTDELHPGAPRPLRAGLLILKAETELGFRPRPLEEAIRQFGNRLGLPVAT
jgi:dTDP-4-dehydrorhamnose reductase